MMRTKDEEMGGKSGWFTIEEGKGRIQGEREGESAVLVRDKVIDQD